MTGAPSLRFLAVVAATGLALHVAVAVAVAMAIPRLYPHRIFNVRAWSDEGDERYHLVGVFLREQAREARPLLAFVGSSVTYGYPWNARFVFSRVVADRLERFNVINASIMAADLIGINRWVVCGALRNGVQMDAAVIELPVVNTTAQFLRLLKVRNAEALVSSCQPGGADPGYLRLALTRPRGIGWLRFLSRTEADELVEGSVRIVPVPDDYFASAEEFEAIRDQYVDGIKTLLTNARQVANTVYAFPSPVYIDGLREIDRDPDVIRAQLRATEAACAAVAGVRCVDTSALWTERSYYYNLTHLNQAGHRATADLLHAAIESSRHQITRSVH